VPPPSTGLYISLPALPLCVALPFQKAIAQGDQELLLLPTGQRREEKNIELVTLHGSREIKRFREGERETREDRDGEEEVSRSWQAFHCLAEITMCSDS
jgi:hypothetical protein